MISTRVPVVFMLMVFVNGAETGNDLQSCAEIQTSRLLVPLGSPVWATCAIIEDCPLVTGQAAQMEWHLDGHLLSSIPVANGSGRVSEVFIASFNHTRAILTCSIQASPPQVVAGVSIRAGYPPEAPQNLSCRMNLTVTDIFTCNWNTGHRETHLTTQYSLHTHVRDLDKNFTYVLPPGAQHFIIPRSDIVLFGEINVYVKAVNDLGEANSPTITLEPMSAAKFDPPEIRKIQVVPKRFGCLRLSWSLSQRQIWMRFRTLNTEVQFKTADNTSWSKAIPVNDVMSSTPVIQCELLHGTLYLFKIRVRYLQSPWSDWSNIQSGVTLESAPTGCLDSWMKVSRDNIPKHLNIHLFWKPSKQFRANSRNVSYIVSVLKHPGEKGKVCTTRWTQCAFQLPVRAKKVYLSAVNAAGKSPPSEVRIYQNKNSTVIEHATAVPWDDITFLVQWKSVVTPDITAYVVEWKPLLKSGLSHIQFEIVDKNQFSLVLPGSFEPYKPYGIWVYPRFKDGIGLPQTVNAYLRQKAPSMVPKIKIRRMWNSDIELTWNEIPLSQRNGIIQSYKIFHQTEKGQINIVTVDPHKRKVILKDLNTPSQHEVFMMASTYGGSLNGSTTHFEAEPFDMVSIITLTTVGVGLSLLTIFLFMTCSSTHKRLKRHLWPNVPDPANSSIKRWSSISTQDTNLGSDIAVPILSHLSFLDLSGKLDKKEDQWSNSGENTSDLGDSICGSPFIPGYSGSNSDSVPYATVIFPGPCNSPSPEQPHVYLRSESTQPLLEAEESFSLKCYQNVANDGREQCFFGLSHDYGSESKADPVNLWEEFPFLQALAMNDAHND